MTQGKTHWKYDVCSFLCRYIYLTSRVKTHRRHNLHLYVLLRVP